ncbi:lasso peptide biosynthesis B2 protein [Pseudomonas citronellolis]|uniref:lasso peptide biosynthesis B2 protein n=1 Tax=Pseudomonas citronellolis TaxID=53408 RepID=UPI0023E35600|nr:lasso peptide biosynthesis B2 protein [Pseudomonas citronellolis]MDF3934778.1 lasso peptide biosynthesis B2 protein [Pseudomonas citronellolis]
MKFSKFAHHIVIEDEMIILDERTDQYLIFDKLQTSEICRNLRSSDASGEESPEILELLEKKVLIKPGIQEINKASGKLKVDIHEWTSAFKLEYISSKIRKPFKTWLTLILVCLTLKFLGLHRSLNKLRHKKRKNSQPIKKPGRAIEISSTIKHVAKYIPFEVTCLQHALALFWAGHNEKLELQLYIGVKNYDFLAHAWIEESGVIIGDRPDLSKLLNVIMKI